MADFSSLTERELYLLTDALDKVLDEQRHYPDDWSSEEKETTQKVYQQLYDDARSKKIWWAR